MVSSFYYYNNNNICNISHTSFNLLSTFSDLNLCFFSHCYISYWCGYRRRSRQSYYSTDLYLFPGPIYFPGNTAECGECCSCGDGGGCAGDCGCEGEAALFLIALVVIVVAFIGLLIAAFAGIYLITSLLGLHIKVLRKRNLAIDYVVADLSSDSEDYLSPPEKIINDTAGLEMGIIKRSPDIEANLGQEG